jgi:hypothetical protein
MGGARFRASWNHTYEYLVRIPREYPAIRITRHRHRDSEFLKSFSPTILFNYLSFHFQQTRLKDGRRPRITFADHPTARLAESGAGFGRPRAKKDKQG